IARLQIQVNDAGPFARKPRQTGRQVGGHESRSAPPLAGINGDDAPMRLFGFRGGLFDLRKDRRDLGFDQRLPQKFQRARAKGLEYDTRVILTRQTDDAVPRKFLMNPLDDLKRMVQLAVEQHQRRLWTQPVEFVQRLRNIGQFRNDSQWSLARAAQTQPLLRAQTPTDDNNRNRF